MTDERGDEWSAALYSEHSSHHRLRDGAFLDDVDLPERPVILDLGCGSGEFTSSLAEHFPGSRVVGLDASADMVTFARQTYVSQRVEFVHGRAEDSSFAAASLGPFDAVFSRATLHWIPRSAQPDVLKNVAGVLNAGGTLRIEMGANGQLRGARRIMDEESARLGGQKSPWYFPTVDEYRVLLEDQGFSLARGWIRNLPQQRSFKTFDELDGWFRSQILIAYEPSLDPSQREEFRSSVLDRARGELKKGDGTYDQDYIRLDVLAHRRSRDG